MSDTLTREQLEKMANPDPKYSGPCSTLVGDAAAAARIALEAMEERDVLREAGMHVIAHLGQIEGPETLHARMDRAAKATDEMNRKIADLTEKVGRFVGIKEERDSLRAQLEAVTKDRDRLERRRGGECQHCGEWVCPPLTCVGCHEKNGWAHPSAVEGKP